MTSHESPSRRRGGRAVLAHVVWWLCVAVAFVLAVAVLLLTLRADPRSEPWETWLEIADLVTPGFLAGEWTQEAAWWREAIRADAAAHAVAALVWLAGGLVLAVLLRPRRQSVAAGAAVMTYTRAAAAEGEQEM